MVFAGESVPVNRKLSEFFLQLHISEKTGRGIPKITNIYGKNAFGFRENSIVVKIPFNWINVMKDKAAKENSKNLKPNKLKILGIIRDNQNITKVKLTEITNLGKNTIDRAIQELKEKGYIKRVGFNKKRILGGSKRLAYIYKI